MGIAPCIWIWHGTHLLCWRSSPILSVLCSMMLLDLLLIGQMLLIYELRHDLWILKSATSVLALITVHHSWLRSLHFPGHICIFLWRHWLHLIWVDWHWNFLARLDLLCSNVRQHLIIHLFIGLSAEIHHLLVSDWGPIKTLWAPHRNSLNLFFAAHWGPSTLCRRVKSSWTPIWTNMRKWLRDNNIGLRRVRRVSMHFLVHAHTVISSIILVSYLWGYPALIQCAGWEASLASMDSINSHLLVAVKLLSLLWNGLDETFHCFLVLSNLRRIWYHAMLLRMHLFNSVLCRLDQIAVARIVESGSHLLAIFV